MSKYIQKKQNLTLPDGSRGPVLLHSCCAPCAGEMMERMTEAQINFSIFFYNPNIHPRKEYEIRKQENIRFAKKMNIPFIDADYNSLDWFEKMKGYEDCLERGRRCTMCFDMRFEVSAQYAHKNGFNFLISSLGLSRWKNMDQINSSGIRAVAPYPNVKYWTYNFRKEGGSSRMYEIAKKEGFYKQEYCGCAYSLRDTNKWRKQKGLPAIKFGNEFYYSK